MEKKLRVLFAAFEAVPFMKTGGLGDVAGSLPMALRAAGCDARLIMPSFATIAPEYQKKMRRVAEFTVQLGWRNQPCTLYRMTHRGVPCYFIENDYYFGRDKAYGYYDDGERIAFFSKAVAEAVDRIPGFSCDILHCNDWHTGLTPVYLRECFAESEAHAKVKTVFTVHNLKFQGQFTDYMLGDVLGLYDVPAAAQQLRSDSSTINFMKGSLCYSDALTTVSPTYAEEIKTPWFGEKLEGIFQRRADILSGILNGIDTDFYNPETDEALAVNYSAADLSGKALCKAALQREFGLEEKADVPLLTVITRLSEQKGPDLILHVLDELLAEGVQLAVLGTGEKKYEDAFRSFAERYPDQVSVALRFDEMLSHRMYAGADLFLMPSQFEPCGLAQMISMRYGTLPVVRETGGLRDSVAPYNCYTGEGTGFSFTNFNAHEMLGVIKSAVELYRNDKDAWRKLQLQAMAANFSWDRAAQDYLAIYRRLCPAGKKNS